MKRWLPALTASIMVMGAASLVLAMETNTPPAGVPIDATALKFLQICAGCHTIGGGKLNGPGLITAAKWSNQELKPAIKRMEQRVGPLRNRNHGA